MNRGIDEVSAVMWALYQTAALKTELSRNKVLDLPVVLCSNPTYGQEFWVVNKRIRSWIQMSSVMMVTGLSLRHRLRRSLVILGNTLGSPRGKGFLEHPA